MNRINNPSISNFNSSVKLNSFVNENLFVGNSIVFPSNQYIKNINVGSFTMTPNGGSNITLFVQQSQTISGITPSDLIYLNISGTPANYISFERAYISNNDTVTLIWRNVDANPQADANLKTIKYIWFDLS